MIPPSFSDLGKAAKDLFDNKFKFGIKNIEVTSKKECATISVKGNQDAKSGTISGTFETKHSTNYGIEVINKWSTKNVLTTEVSKVYKSVKGLKNVGILAFEPDTGKKSLKTKTSYKRDYMNFNSEVFFNSLKPDINVNLVLGCTYPRPYLTGFNLNIDTENQNLKNYTFALGYEKPDFAVSTSVKDLSLFNTYVYQKINKSTDIGVHISYNKNSKTTNYGLAAQYLIPHSDGAFVKAKINQDSLIGLVYGCNINDGVQLTLSTRLDGKKLETGPHNIGLGIVYES